MLRTSFSFPWAYYVCLLSCFNGALAYQGWGFPFPTDRIAFCTRGGFLSIFICGRTFTSMKRWKCWSRCSILPRIPSPSDTIFNAWFTRRCAACWMCPVTSLGVSSFAFWATNIMEKSLILWQRWRSTAISPYYRGNRGRNSHDFPKNPEQALRAILQESETKLEMKNFKPPFVWR